MISSMLARRFAMFALLALVQLNAQARADIVVLNVNSLLSTLTLSGEVGGAGTPPVGGAAYTQQTAGSLVANWGGTIRADLTAGVFSFAPGGSAITALVNPNGPFNTAPNVIGFEAGNYGVTATGPLPLAGNAVLTVNGVYKNLVFDITTGTAQNGQALNGATMQFTAGVLDFGFSALAAPGSATMNRSGANTSSSSVTWDGTTLSIPVTFQTTGGSGRVENWNGTIVAAVPEPSSVALVSLVGVAGICYASIRRRIKVNA